MAVPEFHGETFVAFMDIAGFKSMMTDGKRALLALDAFYNAGFNVVREHNNDGNSGAAVHGFFVSDCGILFVRSEQEPPTAQLEALCRVVEGIHRRTFEKAVQLTTSIAWGEFDYSERIKFRGIDKTPIYGNAYVSAYLDNNVKGASKLYPGECRVKQDGLPENVIAFCRRGHGPVANRMRETSNYFYYDWMRRGQSNILLP